MVIAATSIAPVYWPTIGLLAVALGVEGSNRMNPCTGAPI